MDRKNLTTDCIVIKPDQTTDILSKTPELFDSLSSQYNGFGGHHLVAMFTLNGAWQNWERHPDGEEIVMLLSGSVTFVIDREGTYEFECLTESGDFLVIPKGIWHRVSEAEDARVLFITAGRDTEHKVL